jgi:hypothetical protein
MASCVSCGSDVSFFDFSRECAACTTQRQQRAQVEAVALEQSRLDAQRQAAEQEAHRIATAVQQSVADVYALVQAYGATTLVHHVYTPVDSLVQKEKLAADFTLKYVRPWTQYGWKMVATVPRTAGIALRNPSFKAPNGSGMGGNVAGVYILLQLEITPESIARQHNAIEAYFQAVHRS